MLRGKNIISFSKDWSEDPTSNTHVMSLLAENNKVLWINSISTRTPNLASKADVLKIGSKLRSFARGAKEVAKNFWVYTPIVLPFPHNPAAVWLNQQILKASIGLLRRQLKMDDFQLWTFIPTAEPYVGALGESLSIYYCTDQYSQFEAVDTKRVVAMEQRLCEKVDIVFATANSLVANKKRWNSNTYLASHGVNHHHFAQAMEETMPAASELANLPKPVIGFFGLMHSWFDQELIRYLAEKKPDWSIVLVGRADVSVSRIKGLKNVHLLGRKSYDELPSYCRGFDVGIIPFVVNQLTHHVNPIKLREYLCAGLPVVSTPLPEVRYYDTICTVADSNETFLAGLEKELANDSPEKRNERSKLMEKETWVAKVEALGKTIENFR